jgi:hypothetical protein
MGHKPRSHFRDPRIYRVTFVSAAKNITGEPDRLNTAVQTVPEIGSALVLATLAKEVNRGKSSVDADIRTGGCGSAQSEILEGLYDG